MNEEPRIRVSDKRRSAHAAKVAADTPGVTARDEGEQTLMDESSAQEQMPLAAARGYAGPATEDEFSIDELKRLKADLENDRKRLLRQHNDSLNYATKDLVKRMIPVIDHFQLAIEHGEGGSGVQLALNELLEVLSAEGLEEIEVSEGSEFDPQVHHALAIQPDQSATTETVTSVHRRGYRFKGHVLRAPEVVVAQPPTDETEA
jgi:molecular chaperone GrpE